ncbi:MAG: hypothetical protein ACPGXK_12380 [Phycisphaerae bacterium]
MQSAKIGNVVKVESGRVEVVVTTSELNQVHAAKASLRRLGLEDLWINKILDAACASGDAIATALTV